MADLIITKEMLDKLLELGKIDNAQYQRLQKLQKLLLVEKKPTEFIFDEMEAIKGGLVELIENTKSLKSIDFSKIKKIKGDKGDSVVGPVGPMGKQGPVGPAGKDGKTPVAGKDFPLPKDGKNGVDGKDGKSIVGDKGDKPDHKWEGTKLKFEKPNGKWGKAIDLKGEIGRQITLFGGGGNYLESVNHDATLAGAGTPYDPLRVVSGGGASAFTDLTDVPSSYTGQTLKVVRVNAAETALEFFTLAGGGDALTSNPLSQFAATTSLQLKGVISDETGSGALVFATSPTITTSLITGSSSFDLLNTTATTVNAFGAATTLNIGASATCILNFGGSTTASEFRFLEPSGSGTNYTAFKAVAQSANITYSLPATIGSAGYVLTDAAGDGVLSWAAGGGGGGGITWTATTVDATMSVDNGYLANKGTLLTMTLPTTSAVGKTIRIAGMNAGLWKIAQAASQYIKFGNQSTTVGTGGYLASTLTYDSLEMVCIEADLGWTVISSIGNITII